MNEELSSAREDLSLIRSMLAQTMTGLRELTGFFTAYGLIWVTYAVIDTAQSAIMAVLYIRGASGFDTVNYITVLARLALYAALGVVFLLRRRRAREEGLNAVARKLLDVWGVCLGMFVCLSLCSDAVVALRGYVIRLPEMLISVDVYASAVLRFLFPVLPMLLTAAFSENRGILALGLAAFAFDLLRMVMPYDWLAIQVDRYSYSQFLWIIPVALLRSGFPGLILLAFGHLLQKDGKHGAA